MSVPTAITLLERGAATINDYFYEPVLSVTDLVHARAPRIVKLHGSLGISDHFIIAEEDYRTYPVRFAAFVNFARQVFIENELCLIGFSGDDPNFLQWSGWVRDNLGSSTRRIYLVGSLNLTRAKRKFLEARNVAPIDLASLVGSLDRNDQDGDATKLFLDFLAKAKPAPVHDWNPAKRSAYVFGPQSLEDSQRQFQDDDYAASLLDQHAKIWQSDRKTYPGWLVCPADRRRSMRICFNADMGGLLREGSINKLPPKRSAEILYEFAWRHATAQWPMNHKLVALLAKIADPAQPCDLEKRCQLEVAAALLRAARQTGDEEQFSRWAEIIDKHVERGTDLYAEIAYQRSLCLRDHLDLVALDKMQESVDGPDPIWRVRRASLLFELGKFAEGGRLVHDALVELNARQRQDRNSLWVLSRRAWVMWLDLAIRKYSLETQVERRWLREFIDARCDPEKEIEAIGVECAQGLCRRRKDAVPAVPLFEPGHYRNPSKIIRSGDSADVLPLAELGILMESVGLPVRLNFSNLVGNTARDALDLAFEPSAAWYIWFLRVTSSVQQNATFERYFGRIAVAQLSVENASVISERMIAAIGYWQNRIATVLKDNNEYDLLYAVERLRVLIEAQARLTARQDADAACASFALAMQLGRDRSLQHWWLFEPIANLVKFSIQAVPPSRRAPLVLSALEFPLSCELGIMGGVQRRDWSNPIASLFDTAPNRPEENDSHWSQRIQHLIEAASAGTSSRAEATLRLTYLAQKEALTEYECQEFGQALWSKTDGDKAPLPAGTDLSPSIFSDLPAPKEIDPVNLVRVRLFDVDINIILTQPVETRNWVHSIVLAAQGSLRPTRDQAIRIFDKLVSWRPGSPANPASIDPFSAGLLSDTNKSNRQLIGQALTRVIVPSLSPEDRSEARAHTLLGLISEAEVSTAIAALPYFTALDSQIHARITQCVRRAVRGRSFEEVASGVAAIETWSQLEKESNTFSLPTQLIEQLISGIESMREIGLHALLYCARKLHEVGKLADDDRLRLCQALGDLLGETSYDRIDPESLAAISVSLIRAECVRLARDLQDFGCSDANLATWLDAAAKDPLPEVRFALDG
ncbi:MAG: SIR2 family NAD-dependent protein deacylase [Gammaproteobacteria bacterium]